MTEKPGAVKITDIHSVQKRATNMILILTQKECGQARTCPLRKFKQQKLSDCLEDYVIRVCLCAFCKTVYAVTNSLFS